MKKAVISMSMALAAVNALASPSVSSGVELPAAGKVQLDQETQKMVDTVSMKRSVKAAISVSFDMLVNNIVETREGKKVAMKDIYFGKLGEQFAATGSMTSDSTNVGGSNGAASGKSYNYLVGCHVNCHVNCHGNCHGSRGWR